MNLCATETQHLNSSIIVFYRILKLWEAEYGSGKQSPAYQTWFLVVSIVSLVYWVAGYISVGT